MSETTIVKAFWTTVLPHACRNSWITI